MLFLSFEKKKIIYLLSILFFLSYSSHTYAHGLEMTSASVILRNQSHLTLRLQYDPFLLLNQINISKKKYPFKIEEFANLSEQLFEQQYQTIQKLITTGLVIHFDQQPVDSMRARFYPTTYFRKKIREQFMQQMIQNQSQIHQNDPHDRQSFQVIVVDGFLPKNSKKGSLQIYFPKELGIVSVTYSEPITQTIIPSGNGSFYQQTIDPF